MKTPKVILLTGASSGIGYDTAIALARQGHNVYAAARRVDKMLPLQQYGVKTIRLDVTDDESIQAAVKTIIDNEHRIDVLINNAGYGYFGAVETVSMDEARRQLEVNVFGLARLCQLVLPYMREQHSGRIINIASVAGKSVIYFGGWYHVSKYSVEALSDALRMEMKPFNIDVVIIEPGAIKTDWGIIAADHLAESTSGTAYEKSGAAMSAFMHSLYESDLLSSPAVVQKAICKAVNSRCPRTRYTIGRGASLMLFFHWLLPARWWDAIVRWLGGKYKG